MNPILLILVLTGPAAPQSLPYRHVAISWPYTGQIKIEARAQTQASKREFLEKEHWRLSPGSCGVLGCTVHGGDWVKEKTRVPVAKTNQDRGTAGKEQAAHRTEARRVRAPVYYVPPQRLLRGG